jgi:hypothetical protein
LPAVANIGKDSDGDIIEEMKPQAKVEGGKIVFNWDIKAAMKDMICKPLGYTSCQACEQDYDRSTGTEFETYFDRYKGRCQPHRDFQRFRKMEERNINRSQSYTDNQDPAPVCFNIITVKDQDQSQTDNRIQGKLVKKQSCIQQRSTETSRNLCSPRRF